MGVLCFIKHILLGFPVEVGWALLLVLCLGTILIISIKGIKQRWRLLFRLMFILYIVLIFTVTVFLRSNGEQFDYNFHPFWSYYEAIREGRNELAAEMIMNVVLFIPLGPLSAGSFKRIKWWQVLFVSLCISLTIETMQLLFKRGFAEFDDLFHNVIGCMLGYGMFLFLRKIFEGFSKRGEAAM